MDEDKIIDIGFGGVGAPSSPDDVKIGVTREGHPVYQRRDGTRYQVYQPAETSVYAAKYNPNDTDWWNTGNIATDENGRRFYGNTPEEAQQKYEAWKQQKLQEQGAWSTIDMINAMTGGIFNQLSPTQLGRNAYNIATGNPDFARQFVYGNNGVIPDEWAAEHPALAAVINAGADIGVLGGPSLWRATGRLAANTGRGVATAVKNTPRVVRSIPENVKSVAQMLKDAYNYRSHVLGINSRLGNLNSGFPFHQLFTSDETIKAAIENIKRAYLNHQPINPLDFKIVTNHLSWDDIVNMGDNVLETAVAQYQGSPKIKLLNKLFAGNDLNLSEIEAIIGDDQIMPRMPQEAQSALLNEYDDLLMAEVKNAENQVEAARAARGKMRGNRYVEELDDIINSAEKPATPLTEETGVMHPEKPTGQSAESGAAASTEGSATQAAAASGGVPSTGSMEATVNKVKPLAQKFIDTYNKLRLHYGNNALGEVEVNLLYDDAGNLIKDAVGVGGTQIPLVKSANQVTTATQMMPQYVNQHLIDKIYPKSLYKVSNNAVDWSPAGIRKYIYKMPENMNTQIRHVGNDLYFYGPKAPWQNWVKAVTGVGSVAGLGLGVPTLWGLGKSVFSGDSTPAEPVIRLLDNRIVKMSDGTVNSDTTVYYPFGAYDGIPIQKMKEGVYGQMHSEAAANLDATEAEKAAKQKESLEKVSVQLKNPNDSIQIPGDGYQ